MAENLSGGINSWTTFGPEADEVVQIAFDPVTPSRIYAVTFDGGIFKTEDRGLRWRAVNRGIRVPSIFDVVVDPGSPQTLYLSTYGNGLYKSVDYAESWTRINAGLESLSTYALAMDPVDPRILYVGTNQGVFKSADAGRTWAPTSRSFVETFGVLVIDPREPTTLLAASGPRLFRSTNSGVTWTQLPYPGPDVSAYPSREVSAVALNPQTPSTIYVGTYSGGVLKSQDGGLTWSESSNGLNSLYVSALAIDPSNPQKLFAVGGLSWPGHVHVTVDGGQRWTLVDIGLEYDFRAEAVAIDPRNPQHVCLGIDSVEGGRFVQSEDGGGLWRASGEGLSGGASVSLAVHPKRTKIVFGARDNRLYDSSDGGDHWTRRATLDVSVGVLLPHPVEDRTLFAGTSFGVWKSRDAGLSWQRSSEGLPSVGVGSLVADKRAKYIYAGTSAGVFRSQDEGRSWKATTDVGWLGSAHLAVDPRDGKTAYASSNGRFFRTRDAGRSWEPIPEINVTATSILIDPIDTNTLYVLAWTRILRSRDQGNTWVDVRGGLPGPALYDQLAIDPSRTGVLYALDGRDIFRSENAGATWASFPTNGLNMLATPSFLIINSDGRVLHWSTHAGVFTYEIRPYSLHTLSPCRVMDTRSDSGLSGGGQLEAGLERVASITERCSIPPSARSVAVNVTVTQPTTAGSLTLYETGTETPETLSIAYRAGQTRANNAIVALDPLGRLTVKANQPSGSVHVILDVSGYFE